MNGPFTWFYQLTLSESDALFEGCPFGNIVAIPLTGVLSKYGFDGGWPSVFYCIGKWLFQHWKLF